jgi:hypothetical protein
MEVRGQRHTLAPVTLGKEHPVATDFSNLMDTEIQQLLKLSYTHHQMKHNRQYWWYSNAIQSDVLYFVM